MSKWKNNLDNVAILRYLEKLQFTPERNSQKADRFRKLYIAEIRELSKSSVLVEPVSKALQGRLIKWINTIKSNFIYKERFAMKPILASLMLVGVLLFGGLGFTAYAAQSSQPNDLLYPLKGIEEDLIIQLFKEPNEQIRLSLEYANRRMEEVSNMLQKGQTIPNEVADRLEFHYNLALQVALGMNDEDAMKAIERILANIQQQEQLMRQIGAGKGQEDAVLLRIQAILRSQNRLCEQVLQEPLKLRQIFQQQLHQQQNSTEALGTIESIPPELNATSEPGICLECVPVQDGTGPGPGPNAGSGSQNNQGEGNGSGSCTDCNPIQNGTGPGQGPNTDPGSQEDQGSGDGSGSCTDCNPVQDGTGSEPGPNADSGSQNTQGSGNDSGSCMKCGPD